MNGSRINIRSGAAVNSDINKALGTRNGLFGIFKPVLDGYREWSRERIFKKLLKGRTRIKGDIGNGRCNRLYNKLERKGDVTFDEAHELYVSGKIKSEKVNDMLFDKICSYVETELETYNKNEDYIDVANKIYDIVSVRPLNDEKIKRINSMFERICANMEIRLSSRKDQMAYVDFAYKMYQLQLGKTVGEKAIMKFVGKALDKVSIKTKVETGILFENKIYPEEFVVEAAMSIGRADNSSEQVAELFRASNAKNMKIVVPIAQYLAREVLEDHDVAKELASDGTMRNRELFDVVTGAFIVVKAIEPGAKDFYAKYGGLTSMLAVNEAEISNNTHAIHSENVKALNEMVKALAIANDGIEKARKKKKYAAKNNPAD